MFIKVFIVKRSLSKFPPEIPNPGFKYAYCPILLSSFKAFDIWDQSAEIVSHALAKTFDVVIDDAKKMGASILENTKVLNADRIDGAWSITLENG